MTGKKNRALFHFLLRHNSSTSMKCFIHVFARREGYIQKLSQALKLKTTMSPENMRPLLCVHEIQKFQMMLWRTRGMVLKRDHLFSMSIRWKDDIYKSWKVNEGQIISIHKTFPRVTCRERILFWPTIKY